MSSNLVANVTITGNILVQGSLCNVNYLNVTSANLFTFTTGQTIGTFTFNGPIVNLPVGIGTAPSYFNQLELSTDGAKKLSTSTWATGSDIRIKSDIVTANLARCGEIVDLLDLKYFEWAESHQGGDRHSLGWIAQDVKQFFPNSVTVSQDYGLKDFHSLDSDQLVKVLWGALKHTLIEYF